MFSLVLQGVPKIQLIFRPKIYLNTYVVKHGIVK